MKNPKWHRDEILLCLDLYLNKGGNRIQKNDPKIKELSDLLNQLPIFKDKNEFEKFRNENGVYMKLMNFKSFDKTYKGEGLKGGSKLDETTLNEYFNNRKDLAELANNIRGLTNNSTLASEINKINEDEESEGRKEGKVLYKYHRYRERNSKVIESKKKNFIKQNGRLFCENCGFDYAKHYGKIGEGFIEAHHITPIHKLTEETVTTEKDLILLCANCHRMIHKVNDFDLYKIKMIK